MNFNEHHTACCSFLWSRSFLETSGWYNEHFDSGDSVWIHVVANPRPSRFFLWHYYVLCIMDGAYHTDYMFTSATDPYIEEALLYPMIFTYDWWWQVYGGEL